MMIDQLVVIFSLWSLRYVVSCNVQNWSESNAILKATDEMQQIPSNKSKRPNVILFLADDLGYGDLSYSGHPTSRTPNIDLLARRGRFLTNFYVSSPICSPSRASILTGRYQMRSGVYPSVFVPDSVLGLPLGETTIANVLKQYNYNTQIVGKWHLGVGYNREYLPGDGSFGFDNFLGSPYSHDMCPCNVCFPNNGSCLSQCWHGDVSCPLFLNKKILQQPVDLTSLTEKFLDKSMTFVAESNKENRPFFLYVPFHHIHHPQFSSLKHYLTNARGATGDALAELDDFVGRLVEQLTSLHILDDTMIWFTSDNGPSLSRHELGGCSGLLRCGKGTTWEGGMRVPLIVHWPNRIIPGRNDALVSSLDIFPTILSMIGIRSPDNVTLDGLDVSSAITSNVKKGPRKFYAIYPESPVKEYGPFAVIYKKYKAHFYTLGSDLSDRDNFDPMCPASHKLTKHDPPLLFDLYEDPGERYDLAHKDKYKNVLKLMKNWRLKHMAKMVWVAPRTNVVDKRSEPCCTTSSCEPFPSCCDCKSKKLHLVSTFD